MHICWAQMNAYSVVIGASIQILLAAELKASLAAIRASLAGYTGIALATLLGPIFIGGFPNGG